MGAVAPKTWNRTPALFDGNPPVRLDFDCFPEREHFSLLEHFSGMQLFLRKTQNSSPIMVVQLHIGHMLICSISP